MTLPYALRLLCLCLASFFAIQLVVSIPVCALAPAAMRLARGLGARAAARLALGMRLLPAGVAALVSAGLCAPSYLWLESEPGGEEVGMAFLATALLGGAILAQGLYRGCIAAVRSGRWAAELRRLGQAERVAGSRAWVVDSRRPLVALAGVLRPELAISRQVLEALTPEELDAALLHERAHGASHDNLKRLLMLLAPSPLPFVAGFGALERAWKQFSEWAADDGAVCGDPRRSLALAGALVRVARMGAPFEPGPLCATLLEGGGLEARVERLLAGMARNERRSRPVWRAAGAAAAACLCAWMARPETLEAVHRTFERLVR